ncbi:hypothetical protein BVG19_g1838 [[Candida] boidinii]|nr:hypothetical protein BVG19_g1838 [[Candida] boidinii]OWB53784.1 hypothetical protein B5S27_g5393 [[Candida] boidinii]
MATLLNRKRQRLSSDNATVSFDHASTPTTNLNSSNNATSNNNSNNNNQGLNVTLNTSSSNDGFNNNNTTRNNQSWHFTKAFNNQDTIQLKNNFTSQITEYDIIDLDSDSDEYVFKELNEETDNITTTVKEILDNGRQKKYNSATSNNNNNHKDNTNNSENNNNNNNNNLFFSSSSSSDGFDADNEDNETEIYSYSSSLSSHSNQLNSNNLNCSYQSSAYGLNNFNPNNDNNNSHNSIFTFSDNNNVISSLNNHNTPPHLLSNFNSSTNFPSLSNNNNNSNFGGILTKNAYNQNKKRTKSLPQLEYSKIGYKSLLNKNSVKQKIGDVKTPVIPFNQSFNYTYDSTYSSNSGSKSLRRASFITDLPSTNNNNNNLIDFSNNNNNTTNVSNSESVQCDDDDGHYIIKVGSKFANNRFEIQALLGQGTFGKVVRAYDSLNNKYVAIKIIRNIPKYRDASRIELRVLSMIRKHDPKNINQCIHLRESLDYRGHICIVTDVLKISLFDFLKKNNYIQFPGSHIQAIAKQLLRSVAFLHDLNLIHTDLKPENILLENDKYAKRPYKNIISKKNYYRKVLIDPKVYTIDFGSAIFQDEYHSSVVSTRHYRAPEIILGIGWSFPCDMWSIGCILVELVTGDALFKTHDNLQHLAMIEKVTGQDIDIKLVTQCVKKYGSPSSASSGSSTYSRRSSNSSSFETIAESFSRSTGKLIFPNSDTPDNLINEVNELGILSDIIGLNVGFNFDMKSNLNESILKFNIKKSDRDCYTFWFYFLDLVKKLLIQDSRKRITASRAICHEWFDCGIYDDGTL